MTHEHAFALVSEICPSQAGMLWDTTYHTGCDTAWAVADQYGDDPQEIAAARDALATLAQGIIPGDWQPHVAKRTIEHRTNNAYDSILLIEGGKVIGAWTVGQRGDELENFASPGDLADWEATYPDETDPADYGDLVASK